MVADRQWTHEAGLDDVWPDEGTRNLPLAKEIRRNMYVQRPGYRWLWTPADLISSLLLIGLSGIGGLLGFLGILDVRGVSAISVITAVVVALVFKFQPSVWAACYTAGVQYNQAARIALTAGHEDEAYAYLQMARASTTPRAPMGLTPPQWVERQ